MRECQAANGQRATRRVGSWHNLPAPIIAAPTFRSSPCFSTGHTSSLMVTSQLRCSKCHPSLLFRCKTSGLTHRPRPSPPPRSPPSSNSLRSARPPYHSKSAPTVSSVILHDAAQDKGARKPGSRFAQAMLRTSQGMKHAGRLSQEPARCERQRGLISA